MRASPTVLDKIEGAIARRDRTIAWRHAISAWRKARHSELADLACALVVGLERSVRWPREKKGALHDAWLEHAETKDPLVLGALLETLATACPLNTKPSTYGVARERFRSFVARVEALRAFDDDPRMTPALVKALERAPFTSGDSKTGASVYEPLVVLIERLRDVRCVPALEALLEQPTTKSVNLRKYFASRLPGAIASLRGPRTPLDSAVVARIDTIMASLHATRGPEASRPATTSQNTQLANELVEAVVASLEGANDVGAWEVLADHYLERGDVRGEIISLSLAEERGALDQKGEKHLDSLLRKEKEWLPELARTTKNREYHRGLLSVFDLASKSAAPDAIWDRAAVAEELKTVRRLGQGGASEALFGRFLSSQAMRSLTEVAVRTHPTLQLLSTTPHVTRRLRELRLEFVPDRSSLQLLSEGRFTALRRLTIVPHNVFDIEQLLRDLESWSDHPRIQELTLGSWEKPTFLLAGDRLESIPILSIATSWPDYWEGSWSDDAPRVAVHTKADPRPKPRHELDVRMDGDEELIWRALDELARARSFDSVTLRSTYDSNLSPEPLARGVLEALGVASSAMPTSWRK